MSVSVRYRDDEHRGEKLRPDFDDGELAAHGRCARPHRETYPVTHRAYDVLTNLMRLS